VGAASTTPERTSTTRWAGSGKRDGPVHECRNQWWNPLKKSDRPEPGGWPVLRCAARPYNRGGRSRCLGTESHGEGLRRSRGQARRGKAGHLSRRPVSGERGNRPQIANPSVRQVDGGKARRLLRVWERGGGSVVVRGRESRSHGEGTQRVRREGTGMAGGRR
jgi:hypothetical protein